MHFFDFVILCSCVYQEAGIVEGVEFSFFYINQALFRNKSRIGGFDVLNPLTSDDVVFQVVVGFGRCKV